MPLFEWEARTVGGRIIRGTLRADSLSSLRVSLRKDGLLLLAAREKSERARIVGKIKPMSIVVFTRQLATMITSGLPLVQSLEILALQIEDKSLSAVVKEIKQKIEAGSKFAEALREYPSCFDPLYVNLVVAGEESGTLDTVLSRLAMYMEKTVKLKRKIKSALIYPVSIIVVAVGVVTILLVFVIPVFETMFKDMGAELPAPTQLVVNLSKLLRSTIHFIVGGLFVCSFALRRYYKTESGRRRIDRMLLKAPLFGVLAIKSSVARITRTLATLLSSGVSILDSLAIAAKVSGNKVVEEALLVARSRISEGKNMSEPLQQSGIFPPMVVQMVHVGEQTGALDTMLNKIADFYEEDVDNLVSNLTAMMEPMIMVLLGVILGGLIIAMYLPIFKLGTAIG